MSEENYIVNEGKNEIIEVDGVKYQRLAIRTHVITDQDDVCDVIEKYAKPHAPVSYTHLTLPTTLSV